MPLTKTEFDDTVKLCCRLCAAGNQPRWRPETSEYCHDIIREQGNGHSMTHSYCLATGLRRAYDEGKLNG